MPRTDWRYLSTGAQLRRGDITSQIRTLRPFAIAAADEPGHRCAYCGEIYAPAGPLPIGQVLFHLNGNCPELARRRAARLASVEFRLAMDGDGRTWADALGIDEGPGFYADGALDGDR